jgi:hypothetical protein
MSTWPSAARSIRAVPSPKPEAPPVTMKTLPLISMFHPFLLRRMSHGSIVDAYVNVNFTVIMAQPSG